MVGQQTAARKRSYRRSPSYPGIDLAEAVEKARLIYQYERRNAAPIGEIVGHWGFRSESGPALVAVAALKKFGLLIDEGSGKNRRARLSPEAVRILTDEEDSDERRALLQEAALRPPIHQELRAKHEEDGLPSDGSLRHQLINDYDFTESGAREFIRQFRATLEFTGLTGPGKVEVLKGDKSRQGGQGTMPTSNAGAALERPKDPPRQPAREDDALFEVRIPIALNHWVTVTTTAPLDDAGWERLKAGLDFMKPGLYAVAQPPAMSTPQPAQAQTESPSWLTTEAQNLIDGMGNGSMPAFMTGNLKRIAEENGVAVSPDTTPDQIIEELGRKSQGQE